MKIQQKNENVTILTKELFFRPDENVHIQMSNEFPDYIGVLHSHEYIEVVYVISGKATHKIGGKTYEVKRGDLFIINMNVPHAFYQISDAKEPFVVYDLMFTLDFFDQSLTGSQSLEKLNSSFMFYSLFHGRSEFTPYFSVSGSTYTMFGELFNKIYLEHRGKEKGYIEIIRAYLLQLIITIFRLDSSGVKNASELKNRQTVDYIIQYINENFASHLSVHELAEKVFLNQDYLGRIFKTATGMNISAMIQKVRIEHACHLLSVSNRTITDIATACGFEDMKFFYSIFKKQMDVLPGEYRKQTRKVQKNRALTKSRKTP